MKAALPLLCWWAASLAPLAAAPLAPEAIEGMTLRLPQPGDESLLILSPNLLALERINSKSSISAAVDSWDFVRDGALRPPELTRIKLTVDGQPAAVAALGFRRRVLYAPLKVRDLRIDNALYLRLAQPLQPAQAVKVENPDGTLWPAGMTFAATADPARFNPAIHVNQEGYTLGRPKKAMVGFYLGSLGEMEVGPRPFTLVQAGTGKAACTGTLTARFDTGWGGGAAPYQEVFEADFTACDTAGSYRLRVEGLGESPTFTLGPGLAMSHARAYALGLYHQRCGMANALPWTRFTHDACHLASAEVPVPQSSFTKAWANIASANADASKNPRHTAPRLENEDAQLYPFVRTGKIDVSGGHHDAGDYSKYTINSALLIESLTIAADVLPGVGALDNLGLPESGDGKSDLLQEAKWEADFLVKMQDKDGGFYFLVYPKARKYEDDVLPDRGDPQIVFPKNTSATASATAALAELSSSPLFRQQFPLEAARYLLTARRGWAFLKQAIAAHGKDGSYQKITHYGDGFMHDDELAWAACAMYAATGDESCHTLLRSWYDPGAKDTKQWTWWRGIGGYGCAARLYAFAATTGRLQPAQLDPAYLDKCRAEVIGAGEDQLTRSLNSAYGTAFESESKRPRSAGWYFSADRAFEMAFAQQLAPKPEYLDAMLSNLNYEAGCNPVNVSFLTGYGTRQQREIVSQYAENDRRVLPPSGLPLGNLCAGFMYLQKYGAELGQLTFPPDGQPIGSYPLYDRWGDSFNTSTEAVVVNQGRGLALTAFLAAGTPLATQPWRTASAQIELPLGEPPAGTPVTVTLRAKELDLSGATVIWEARDQEPARGGAAWKLTPPSAGPQWVEAEARWPDGRRVFAQTNFTASAAVQIRRQLR